MTQERETGFYHVNIGSEWFVAEYRQKDNEWLVPGEDEIYEDTDFDEIGERITREGTSPSPKPMKGNVEVEAGSECMYCGELVPGVFPKYCCNGSDCGCMGQPIEPIACSKGCYDMIMNRNKSVKTEVSPSPQPTEEEVRKAAEE